MLKVSCPWHEEIIPGMPTNVPSSSDPAQPQTIYQRHFNAAYCSCILNTLQTNNNKNYYLFLIYLYFKMSSFKFSLILVF